MKYIIILLLILLMCGSSSAWLSDYDYRMEITVNNGGGSTLNYHQFNFTNDTNILVSGGHIQANGGDCRITDTCDHLIPFWNETPFNATNTKIWVNATTLTTGDNTFYMYYGNSSADSVSNGDTTFEFFDDIEAITPSYSNLIPTTTYDYFGFSFRNKTDEIMHITRSGTNHVTGAAAIVKTTYNETTDTWSAYSNIVSDGINNARGLGGGKIGSDIFIFHTRSNTDGSWINTGFIKSSDGGSTWSSFTAISNIYCPYGGIFQVGNTYYQPIYGTTYADCVDVKLIKSTDSGATWEVGPYIYDGTETYTETSVAKINETHLLAVIRRDSPIGAGSHQGVYQSTSSDGGITWSTPIQTNLGYTDQTSVVPWVEYDSGTNELILIWGDRSDQSINIAIGKVDTVFGSSISWGTKQILIDESIDIAYPSLIKINTSNYYAVWGREVSVSDVDLYGGIYNSVYGAWSEEVGSNIGKESTIVKRGKYSIKQTSTTDNAEGYKTYPTKTENFTTEVDLQFSGFGDIDDTRYFTIGLEGDLFNSVYTYFENGAGSLHFEYYNETAGEVDIMAASADTWYKLKYNVYPPLSIFDLDIDGVRKVTGGGVRGSISAGAEAVSLWGSYCEVDDIIYADNIFIRRYASSEPTTSLGNEEARGNFIVLFANQYGMLRKNVSTGETFSVISDQINYDVCFSWWNPTTDRWESYWVGDLYNADTSVPEHEAYFVLVNHQTTIFCNTALPETIVIPTGWSTTYLREDVSKTLTTIKNDMGAHCTSLYAWNHTANAWTNNGAYSVLPNQGLLVNSDTGFSWDGSVV